MTPVSGRAPGSSPWAARGVARACCGARPRNPCPAGVVSKSSWWLLKGEATSFAVKPTVLGAEQSTMAVFPVMLIPGSDDYANLIAHGRPYDLQGQLHGLTLAPFEREVENKPAGIVFYLCYECDQKAAASAGGTGGPLDVFSPDPTSHAKKADFGLPKGESIICYRRNSELYDKDKETPACAELNEASAKLGPLREFLTQGIILVDLAKAYKAGGHAMLLLPDLLDNLKIAVGLLERADLQGTRLATKNREEAKRHITESARTLRQPGQGSTVIERQGAGVVGVQGQTDSRRDEPSAGGKGWWLGSCSWSDEHE